MTGKLCSIRDLGEFAEQNGGSSRKVRRWHERRGILPQPTKIGKCLYFEEQEAKAAILTAIEKRTKYKLLRRQRLERWFDGIHVERAFVVQDLEASCLNRLASLFVVAGSKLAFAERCARKLRSGKRRSILVARLERKLPDKEVHSFIANFLMIVMGDGSLMDSTYDDQAGDSSDGRTMAGIIRDGLQPVRRPLSAIKKPMAEFWNSAPKHLETLASDKLLVPANMRKRLHTATLTELEQAREWANVFCDRLPLVLAKHDPYGLLPFLKKINLFGRSLVTVFLVQLQPTLSTEAQTVMEAIQAASQNVQ